VSERLTKNERREQAREEARRLREEAKRKERRNKILLQGGIIVAVLAVVVIVALVLVNSVRPAGPGPRNMASDGILIEPGFEVHRTAGLAAGEEPVPNTSDADLAIQVYMDFGCPHCQEFELTNADYIGTLIESGAGSVEIFPVSILDNNFLGTKYSTRAANAIACAADAQPEAVWDLTRLLFENQPAPGTGGLDDAELVEFANQAGATSGEVESCIRDRKFQNWVRDATTRARNNEHPQLAADVAANGPQIGGFTGTPTIYVNGVRYSGSITDVEVFKAFLQSMLAGDVYEQPTETPTPTPTPAG